MSDAADDASLLPEISPDAPCGPDLDADGDAEFLNYMATIEGQLPAAYFSFDRKSIDFAAALDGGAKLLKRTHDARLLVLLAKLAILNRDLEGFARWLAILARLFGEHWEEAHPRGEDGDFIARIMQLSTLDDGPVVILPLQYAPLAETQRDGVLTYRAQMVALGDVAPREKEALPNAAAIERILANADMERLSSTLRALQMAKASIGQIRATLIERVGFEQALNFDALAPLIDKMTSFIQAAVAQRDPSFAVEEEAPAAGQQAPSEAPAPAGAPAFASLADVDAALGAALGYFETNEPSSAAVLLIGQAQRLLGKNLYEVMKALAPAHADAARISVGADTAFLIPVSGIAGAADGAEAIERRETPAAASRAAALGLIDAVAAHMRKAEPSSPAPYLLERAKGLASRDFLGLLKELLSDDALSSLKGR